LIFCGFSRFHLRFSTGVLFWLNVTLTCYKKGIPIEKGGDLQLWLGEQLEKEK